MIRKLIIALGLVSSILLLPSAVMAQGAGGAPSGATGEPKAFGNLKEIVEVFDRIVDTLLPIVFAIAVLAFFWGIMMYVFSASGETKKNGKNIMLWALIAVAIMASLFGIIKLAQQTLGISGENENFRVPTVEKIN